MALPVNGSTHLIPAYYSFYRPRKDERLSWPSWLTYSGWLTHISGHPSATGRAQDRESSPARDRRSTTVPRHQPWFQTYYQLNSQSGIAVACSNPKLKWRPVWLQHTIGHQFLAATRRWNVQLERRSGTGSTTTVCMSATRHSSRATHGGASSGIRHGLKSVQLVACYAGQHRIAVVEAC